MSLSTAPLLVSLLTPKVEAKTTVNPANLIVNPDALEMTTERFYEGVKSAVRDHPQIVSCLTDKNQTEFFGGKKEGSLVTVFQTTNKFSAEEAEAHKEEIIKSQRERPEYKQQSSTPVSTYIDTELMREVDLNAQELECLKSQFPGNRHWHIDSRTELFIRDESSVMVIRTTLDKIAVEKKTEEPTLTDQEKYQQIWNYSKKLDIHIFYTEEELEVFRKAGVNVEQ